jgi:2-polyprenyl-3-methyl-5-hydroxy-6-metoxy-1,4-benzoquinol methylase
MELTEKLFWEKFWNSIKLPQKVNYNFKNDRIIAETIKKYIPSANKDKTVLEIGCAPGKWLVMFNKELGYKIAGFEYCEPAYDKTLENFQLNNIDRTEIEIKLIDFLNANFTENYNVVFSLGFIEHFDDTENIFSKHTQLMNDDGYLIIGIPNFKGINYYIQSVIDNFLEQKIIINHNLKAMDPKLMDLFASKNNLKRVFSGYVGGFEPNLFNPGAIKTKILRLITIKTLTLLSIVFGKMNTRFTSGYIMTIYKK